MLFNSSKQIIPCVYAVLPNKRTDTYRTLFRQLLEAEPDLQPESILTDFEIGAITAARETFPETNLQGCFYHIAQCVYQKVQTLGLATDYSEEEELSVHVWVIPAVAFVPQEDTVQAFDVLRDEMNGDD